MLDLIEALPCFLDVISYCQYVYTSFDHPFHVIYYLFSYFLVCVSHAKSNDYSSIIHGTKSLCKSAYAFASAYELKLRSSAIVVSKTSHLKRTTLINGISTNIYNTSFLCMLVIYLIQVPRAYVALSTVLTCLLWLFASKSHVACFCSIFIINICKVLFESR